MSFSEPPLLQKDLDKISTEKISLGFWIFVSDEHSPVCLLNTVTVFLYSKWGNKLEICLSINKLVILLMRYGFISEKPQNITEADAYYIYLKIQIFKYIEKSYYSNITQNEITSELPLEMIIENLYFAFGPTDRII